MSIITATTTYPDGAALNIAGHNENVFSTTAGKGVMSEPNGNLQQSNLVIGFAVRDEHVMSEEALFARQDSSTFAFDIFNNVFGQREDEEQAYVAIGGLNQRVYIPFDCDALLWQWSFFVAPWRPYVSETTNPDPEDPSGNQDIPDLFISVFFDGVENTAYRRALAVSADIRLDSNYGLKGSASSSVNYENVTAMWYDISKLVTPVAKGFHEVSVRIYMPRFHFMDSDEEAEVRTFLKSWSPAAPAGTFGDIANTVMANIHTRVTFGTRNIKAIVFK
jgi:hypothetical protein